MERRPRMTPPDVDRVVDGVPQAVAGRDVEVDLGGPRPADLDRVDDEVRAGEGGPTVEVGLDGRAGAQGVGRPAGHPLGRRRRSSSMSWRTMCAVAQLRVRQDVAEQVAGELDAAGADEDDPHLRSLLDATDVSWVWSIVRRASRRRGPGPTQRARERCRDSSGGVRCTPLVGAEAHARTPLIGTVTGTNHRLFEWCTSPHRPVIGSTGARNRGPVAQWQSS